MLVTQNLSLEPKEAVFNSRPFKWRTANSRFQGQWNNQTQRKTGVRSAVMKKSIPILEVKKAGLLLVYNCQEQHAFVKIRCGCS